MYVGKMSPMFEVNPIPAFRDNYIWLIRRGSHAVVVDPGDAAPVISTLQTEKLTLDAILVTHHHDDHIGGITELIQLYPTVKIYAPHREQYLFRHEPVGEDDIVELDTLGLSLNVMETPGHTLGHVVYYGANSLFCGDTLFSCGCGRLFEGSCEQLYYSLQRLASLPPQTRVYCTHEYTRHNIKFARMIDPENPKLQLREHEVDRLLAANRPTLPTTIGLELATNPFLRCDSDAIKTAVARQAALIKPDAISVFCAIRKLRNAF
ncbi:hydroxyacylglutathione hydrolase [Methylobacillus sp. MM3]|uniref:hydroxyacylglutathione hydrolase n=1 Tax=Methylobacillus sp. MM3 TaxID=1848039 RepID=UPI001F0A2D41|nr:hydroxyacylglutathione hydrolase [Methylobacillus sp. MM3]